MSNTVRWILVGLLCLVAYAIVASGALSMKIEPLHATSVQQQAGAGTQSGQETIAGAHALDEVPQLSVAQLNAILAAYHSPLAGAGQQVYDLGRKYNISSDYALAFWVEESILGTSPLAQITLNPGNLRCMDTIPCYKGYAQFRSWYEGMERWYRLIRYGYVEGLITKGLVGHACTTLEQIVPVYAPSGDNNNPKQYITVVLQIVSAWRAGKVVA